jgi:hypothetical protein
MSEPTLHIFSYQEHISHVLTWGKSVICGISGVFWTHDVLGADIMMQLDDVVDATHRKAVHTAQ